MITIPISYVLRRNDCFITPTQKTSLLAQVLFKIKINSKEFPKVGAAHPHSILNYSKSSFFSYFVSFSINLVANKMQNKTNQRFSERPDKCE